MTDPIADAAQALQDPEATQNLTYAQLRQGVVTDINAAGNTCTLTLSGDTANPVTGVKCLSYYQPVVGDTIWCMKQGTDILGLGRIDIGTNTVYGQLQGFCSSFALLTSSSFVALPTAINTVSVTKRYATSVLNVQMAVTGWANATGAQLQCAVNILGTNYVVGGVSFDIQTIGGGGSGTTNFTQRCTATGSIVIPSLASGTYTLGITVRNASATGTIQVNTGDWYSMTAVEQL
jgi:hypothetical protein